MSGSGRCDWRSWRRFWFAAWALLPASLAPSAAQPPAPRLVESAEVRVVNVDVTVVDKKGEPVRGLGREDFNLFEDGREVAVTNFFVYQDADTALASGPLEDSVEQGANRGAETEALVFAVFIDDRNLNPAHRSRVLMDLREFLTAWQPLETRFVLAVFRNRLRIVSGPVAGAKEILAALEEGKGFASGLAATLSAQRARTAIITSYEVCERAAERTSASEGATFRGSFCRPCQDTNWQELMVFAEEYARSEETRTAVAVSGLADLVGALSGLDGRKIVLYVGDGFQQRPGIAMLSYLGDLCVPLRPEATREVYGQVLQYDESTRFNQLTAYANSSRVTFFMLDAGGVRSTAASSVEFASKKFAPTGENDQIHIANLQNSLFVVANETGGRAILNANRPLPDLLLLPRELGATYSLGFVPDHPPSGRAHLLEVQLAGKSRGRRVRYRRSYLDKTVDTRLADRLVSALYLDATENPLGVGLGFGEPKLVVRGLYSVPVLIDVPQGSMVVMPGSEGRTLGQARLFMAASDDQGRRTRLRQELISLGPDGEQPSDGWYRFVVDMDLRAGVQTVVVGVRDEVTHTESVLRRVVAVP